MYLKSIDKALLYLNSNLQNMWAAGSRLPSGKELAHNADVSYVTMNKALSILKKEKKIASKKKAGIFAGPIIPKNVDQILHLPRKMKWETIKEALCKDILIGQYHDFVFLPSIKELSGTYHVGFPVLKSALQALCNEGLVQMEKKYYRITRHITIASSNIIYLFAHEFYSTNSLWHFQRDNYNLFIRILESTCHERKMCLVKKYYTGPKPTHADFNNALGSIVFHSANSVRTPDYQDTLDQLIFIQQSNTPSVLITPNISEIIIPDSMQRLSTGKTPLFFLPSQSSNEDAGQKVGQLLLSHGHTQVCFLAPSRQNIFIDRYKGLCTYFKSAGLTHAIPFLVPSAPLPNELAGNKNTQSIYLKVVVDQLRKNLGMAKTFSKGMTYSSEMDLVLTNIDSLYQDLGNIPASQNEINISWSKAKDELAATMIMIYKMQLPDLFKTSLANNVQEVNNALHLQASFYSLFSKALSLPHITAWVCAEDHLTNAAAFEFCKLKNIKIPEKLGLIGFQDHFESCTNNISSYHFDFAKTALKALSLVTHPKHSAKLFCKKNSGEFAFEGMVIDRGSV